MLHFKNVTQLTEITATAAIAQWPTAPIVNGVRVKSSKGRSLHAYATTAGLVIFAPEQQVGIAWADLMAIVEKVAPTLAIIPALPAQPISAPVKGFSPNKKTSIPAPIETPATPKT